jgi:hypothetical protein
MRQLRLTERSHAYKLKAEMRPLNPTQILWLEGTRDEVNRFLADTDRVVKLGHEENVRHLLACVATPQNLNMISPYLERGVEPTAAFVMVQGRIIGLVLKQTGD